MKINGTNDQTNSKKKTKEKKMKYKANTECIVCMENNSSKLERRKISAPVFWCIHFRSVSFYFSLLSFKIFVEIGESTYIELVRTTRHKKKWDKQFTLTSSNKLVDRFRGTVTLFCFGWCGQQWQHQKQQYHTGKKNNNNNRNRYF